MDAATDVVLSTLVVGKMILHSKFRDYYDYLIGIYGKDDKIVYEREKMNNPIFVHSNSYMRLEVSRRYIPFRSRRDTIEEFLFVNGRCYPRFAEYGDDGSYEKMKFRDFSNVSSGDKQRFFSFNDPKKNILIDQQGMEHPYFIMLTKLVGNPIFMLTRTFISHSSKKDHAEIAVKEVNLSEIGFQKFISAHEIYVELQYFLTNIIKTSPDIMPEGKPPLTDIERLQAKGFDKKKSFRHRK